MKAGSKYLFANFKESERWFTYGNFYAAPAQYMIGGKTWADWYAKIKEHLLAEAKPLKDGKIFWDSGHNGSPGPHWTTAVNARILAMPSHYVPLYQR